VKWALCGSTFCLWVCATWTRGGPSRRAVVRANESSFPDLVDGDLNLAPGVQVLRLPGHVDGFQAPVLRLPESGTMDIAGDAISLQENLARDNWGAFWNPVKGGPRPSVWQPLPKPRGATDLWSRSGPVEYAQAIARVLFLTPRGFCTILSASLEYKQRRARATDRFAETSWDSIPRPDWSKSLDHPRWCGTSCWWQAAFCAATL
jgi:hypothetical protein